MKIKNIFIKEYNGLKDLNVSFENEDKILNTVVLVGINGSGKTRVLESVLKYYQILPTTSPLGYDSKVELEIFGEKIENESKIIYVPTEINFQEVERAIPNFKKEYEFLNIVDTNLIKDIPSYIATKIFEIANEEENMPMGEVRKKVFDEINNVFDILELDIKIVGISKNEKSMPIFQKSNGETFGINELSSGEKQLFLRTLAIKMLEPKNSIILIDEPEISLHPKWQQKIVSVYEKIGENNQIILATHSPHIIGSVKKEQIILLMRNENGIIEAKNGKDFYNSYGQPVGRILEDIMGLETDRN